ncbi:hypothetical protein ACO2Q1_01780 [Brevundimonas sp. VNH65]|uniref:hypothetical protein n=1 Tax=Brevundimonas sp. VNH65 TaxID=3400917 RepID=UPI003BFD74BF
MTLRWINVLKLLAISTVVIGILAVVLVVVFAGSVTVHDPDGQVVSARIVTSGGQTQSLHRIPGRRLFGIPKLDGEGEVELVCRSGKVRRGGYVTPHLATELEVTSGSDCGLS